MLNLCKDRQLAEIREAILYALGQNHLAIVTSLIKLVATNHHENAATQLKQEAMIHVQKLQRRSTQSQRQNTYSDIAELLDQIRGWLAIQPLACRFQRLLSDNRGERRYKADSFTTKSPVIASYAGQEASRKRGKQFSTVRTGDQKALVARTPQAGIGRTLDAAASNGLAGKERRSLHHT